MAKIIKHRRLVEVTRYCLFFERKNAKGSGYSFECDQNGNVFTSKQTELSKQNLKHCRDNPQKFFPPVIRIESYTDVRPAVLKCDCGEEVDLSCSDNDCKCGRIFNSFGQELNPRHLWEG